MSIDGVFNEEIDKIKTFMSTFDSKEQNIQQKLEQNIKEMKLILLRFHSYYFNREEYRITYNNTTWAGYSISKGVNSK